MGHRITRAAPHLPPQTVLERRQAEPRLWRRHRWEIIYQALTAPRHAEDIARTVGVSPTTVHRVISTYNRLGVAAVETPGTGGRRHQYLTLEQERAFLQPFLVRAARGELPTAVEIQQAFEAETKQPVADSTIYRLLARHGLRLRGAPSRSARAIEHPPAHEQILAVRQRGEWHTTSANRPPLLHSYPSDLTDQEWAILEPLLPLAKPGGRPRTSDLREVITAILYVDRTGGQWRALPHDFPPWSTVWSYFRTWRVPRDLGAPAYDAAGTDAREAGTSVDAQRGQHSQPIGENEPKRGQRGYDGGKKVKGRKRHVLVDTNGLACARAGP